MIDVKIVPNSHLSNFGIPSYSTDGSAGADLYADSDYTIAPGETVLVKTGIKLQIPEGYEAQIRPRSGLSLKTKLRIANAPGTIDSDYIGEIGVIIDNISTPSANFEVKDLDNNILDSRISNNVIRPNEISSVYKIYKGNKIAQIVFNKIEQARFEMIKEKQLHKTERGSEGYGSTGI